MPIPRAVAKFNKRVTNKVAGVLAPFLPGFALVEHTGRKSGKSFSTPVNAFHVDGGIRFALTYGRGSDWVRNVLAADGCTVIMKGKRIALTAPVLGVDPRADWAPPGARQILRATGSTDYLQCRIATQR